MKSIMKFIASRSRLQRFTAYIVMALVFALFGCNRMVLEVEHDKATSFAGMKKYDWVHGVKDGSIAKTLRNPIYAKTVQDEVQHALQEKGFQRVDDGRPDFLVSFRIVGQDRISVGAQEYPTKNVELEYLTARPTTYIYIDGNLVLNIFTPDSSKIIWHGHAHTQLESTVKPSTVKKKIVEAVNGLMKSFPPQD